jgi:hypothetical protein
MNSALLIFIRSSPRYKRQIFAFGQSFLKASNTCVYCMLLATKGLSEPIFQVMFYPCGLSGPEWAEKKKVSDLHAGKIEVWFPYMLPFWNYNFHNYIKAPLMSRILDSKGNVYKKLSNLAVFWDDASNPDRVLITLANYNVGRGHILDAQEIALEKGLDPNSWSDLKEVLPLLSYSKYYKNSQ